MVSARRTPAPGKPRERDADHTQNENRQNGDEEVPGEGIQDQAGGMKGVDTQDEPSRQPEQKKGKGHKKKTKKRRGRK